MKKDNVWEEELELLKSIVEEIGLEEEIKWGHPVYVYQKKNLVSFGGFKDFFTLWFYDGVFLEDKKKLLINANEEKTKALRQWRFYSKNDIDRNAITSYILEAMRNVDDGRTWKPQKSVEILLPTHLEKALLEDVSLKRSWDSITLYKRKEFVEYIDDAKREETKIVRLGKIIPMIMSGIGLNDKYR